ncbi:MAG: DUF4369 domain-containing protein [Paludibacter sp.]|jgi:peroxiredoxin|nr:DUF4369 domain-containing protein [Paludibacter sp.]MDX9919616.1 thioredoxin-like domain-containing protein [Paludibacter sp.]
MKIKYLFFILLPAIVGCSQQGKFKIEGEVTDAEGKMLYIEQTGLLKTVALDSVKLKADGAYKFKLASPEYPEFYRLRVEDKVINFAIDSTEHLVIKAAFKNFATGYSVEGSEMNLQIKELRQSLSFIQAKANKLTPQLSASERNALLADVEADIEKHKEMARKIILTNPRSSAAYFAIYQKIGNTYLFSPYVKADKPYCAAVATAYNAFMPDYIRTKNLYGLVMDAIKAERKAKDSQAWREVLDNASAGYIDIELPDRSGNVRKLSELEGKVVLIDFSAYQMEKSVQYTFELRELYNKYSGRGFEIYQVSLDRSKLLWEESVANIPWVCVRDENGPESVAVSTYNVQSAPTVFLMNRKGEIIARNPDFSTLDASIAKLL